MILSEARCGLTETKIRVPATAVGTDIGMVRVAVIGRQSLHRSGCS
jgi:hypothetical protein